jgi:SAM-dependent methyltransferase
VLALAIVARLIAIPLLPTLSDDGFRYLWDGILQIHNINPYLYLPSDVTLAGYQESELYEGINSKYYYSVYPPASQLIFWLGGIGAAGISWEAGWYVIKITFVALEVAGLWAASRLVAPRYLVIYAWHPLSIIEGAGQAHTDVAMVGAILLCIFAYRRGLNNIAVAAITVAGWFKLYPFLLLPFLLNRVGWKNVWVALVLSALLWAPYATTVVPNRIMSSLALYTQLFEFNAGPYYTLKWVGYTLTGSDVGKVIGPILQKIFAILAIAIWGVHTIHRSAISWIWLLVIGLLWATATTVHPWYLLGVLALVPFVLESHPGTSARLYSVSWIWLSVTSLGTYLLYSVGEGLYWAFVSIGWGGWALCVSLGLGGKSLALVMQQRASDKWEWIRRYVKNPRQLLDLGAGDGYVAAVVAKDTNAQVMLADVVDYNRTDLPLKLYTGEVLPFDDGVFDTTLLLFVLHHSKNPQSVLREARRVTSGRIVVIESVVESKRDRWWLNRVDRLANWVRSGGKMHEQPLHFDTPQGWRDRFSEAGLVAVAEDRRGRWLHKQHLFILKHKPLLQ